MATKAHHAVVPSADVDMQMESTSPSSHETSITIDECSEMKGKAPTSFRWDMVFLMYILSIAFTALTFGGSYNATYSPLLICFGFWHFGFESSLSIYFTYSGKGAVFASRVVLGICFVQGALALVFTDAMTTIFSLEFIASDSFSAISSVCLMFNQSIPTRFKVLPFAVSLHYIGVSLKICMLPTELFESNKVPNTAQTGSTSWLSLCCRFGCARTYYRANSTTSAVSPTTGPRTPLSSLPSARSALRSFLLCSSPRR